MARFFVSNNYYECAVKLIVPILTLNYKKNGNHQSKRKGKAIP